MKARLGISLLIGLCWAQSLTAEPASGQQRKLADVQNKIQHVGADVKRLIADKSTQIEQLKQIEKQFGEQARIVNTLKADIRNHERQLQEIRTKIAATQKDLQLQKSALQSLLKSAYLIGDRQDLSVLFNQRDPALSGRMMVYYDYISKARLYKLKGIEDDVIALHRLEAEKDGETLQLQDDLSKNEHEMAALQQLKDRREQVLASIDKDYRQKNDQLAHLMHDEKRLETVLSSLPPSQELKPEPAKPERRPETHQAEAEEDAPARPIASPQDEDDAEPAKPAPPAPVVASGKAFTELQGLLPWPVQGAIAARFGSRRFETTWDGTVINAREGAGIHAIAPGRVVFADWLRGYGLMIIVDHGKGFMSLYAFNQSLYKRAGERVSAGETLAAVGRSGGRSSAALYFGIRKNGRPVDPERWCRKPG